MELSRLLNTGLDRGTLNVLISLCEQGVDPDALAMVVTELRREAVGLAHGAKKAKEEEAALFNESQ